MRRLRTHAGIAVAILVALGCTESVPAPAMEIPEMPPHPRLFMTPERLEQLRAECLGGPKRQLYRQIRDRAERGIPERGEVNLSHLDNHMAAFVYLIEGNRRFGEAAARGLMAMVERGRWLGEQQTYWFQPLIYDHVFDLLTQEQIDAVIETACRGVPPGQLQKAPTYNLEANAATAAYVTGITFLGDASTPDANARVRAVLEDGYGRLFGEGNYDLERGRATFRGGVLPSRLHYAGDGGYHKDRAYTTKDLASIVHAAEASAAVGMRDIYGEAETYFRRVVDYLLWSTRPDGLGLRQTTGSGGRQVTSRGYEALAGIARRFDDGHAAWLMQNDMAGGGGTPPGYEAVLFCILWDPGVRPVAPTVETMGRWVLFGAEGLPHVAGTSAAERFIYRSGWEVSARSDDFMFHLDASDFLGDNPYWNVGGFELFHRGALAIKSGIYHRIDDHYHNYHAATVGANALLVRSREGTEGRDPGAQDDIREAIGWPQNLFDLHDGSPFDRGGIDSVRTMTIGGREWHLVSASLRTESIYVESKRAKRWDRRVAVTDGAAIVYDRIEPTDPGADVAWLLHTLEEPSVGGEVVAVDVPGHVTWHDGATFRATRTRNLHGMVDGGSLDGACFLPADPTVRKLGGEGYQFWVDDGIPEPGRVPAGRNYMVDEVDAMRAAEGEAGMWRLEVRGGGSGAVREFLVLLDATGGAIGVEAAIDASVAGVRVPGGRLGFTRVASSPERARFWVERD